MQDNDPVIGGILFAIEMLVRQVAWDIKPGDDSAEGEKLAEFVKDCLHHMRLTWADTLGEIVTFLPWGFAVNEIVYKRRDDGRLGWDGWFLRGQESLLHWEFDDNYNPIIMVQLGPPDWAIHNIPLSKCLHFRTSVRKNNPEGYSILRHAYLPYYYGKQIMTIEAIGVERDLAGYPVMRIPGEKMLPDANGQDQTDFTSYKQQVVNIRRDEQEGLILPSDRDPDTKEYLYDFTLMSTGGARQFNTDAIIARYDQRKAMAMLADFIMLGHEAVGSHALGASKIDLFVKAMEAWLDVVNAQVNDKAIPDLLRYNGIVVDKPPTLYHDDLADVDLGQLSTYLTALVGAGVPLDLDPNGPQVKRLYALGGLPELTDDKDMAKLMEQQKQVTEAKAPPVQPGMNGNGNGRASGGTMRAGQNKPKAGG